MAVPVDIAQHILTFEPNIRWEDRSATSGYTWGKPAKHSNILEIIRNIGEGSETRHLDALDLNADDIVAERWLVSDDPADGSQLQEIDASLREVLDTAAAEILGPLHMKSHGEYLHCIMKQLDTNSEPTKGSLSVQIHPKPGHPSRPAKPEMWTGKGTVYLGWNQDVTPDQIRDAQEAGELEELLNTIDMDENFILVEGGMIHAIRYDSFLYEWSMAPAADDVAKGTLKDATVAPYDRTDGKTPRPGKEKLEESLDLLKESDAFGATEPEDIFTQPELLLEERGVEKWRVFTTDHVIVEKYVMEPDSQLEVRLERGMPLYVEKGAGLFSAGKTDERHIAKGREALVPYATETLHVQSSLGGLELFTWYAP